MKIKEAIRLLRNLFTMCEFTDAYGDPIDSDAYYDAVDMAISALQAQADGDCISRQSALDALIALTVYSNKRDLVKEADNHPNTWIEGVAECIDEIEDMPSAQPEPIRINLNEPIKVKLTDWGKEIYYHQYDRTNQIAGREICKPRFPREDENGYTEFQLWCFIELYGMHMGMTLPNVIEPLEIVYER